MYCEKFGNKDRPIIVFLHGANFVHTFGRQYVLADRFHLLVPHIMGYGNEGERIFETEKASEELTDFIYGIGRKVTLTGFSLGAQLAVKLSAEHPELLERAVIVSPWLIKEEREISKLKKLNAKQLKTMQNPFFCHVIGIMQGLPREKRKEFAAQMQNIRPETQNNSVDNGITLDTIRGFKNIPIPTIAIAGEKEQKSVRDSVKALGNMNPRCKTEIWEKAGHNIPPVFYKRFNTLLTEFIEGT